MIKINPLRIFNWNGISIRLKEDVFKAGTDAILLASWIPETGQNPGSILDAGTGSGILALILRRHYPETKIVAIDQDPNAVALAQENFNAEGRSANLTVRLQDVFSKKDKAEKFEMVVCNPPFYFNQYNKESKPLHKAKHAEYPVQDWMDVLSERIEAGGALYIIVPYTSAFEWIRAANQRRLYCQRRLDVITSASEDYPSRSLFQFSSHLCKPRIDRMKMFEKDGSYSQEYQSFAGMKISGKL